MTRRRAGELVRKLFEILAEHPQGMKARDALGRLAESVEMTDSERSEYRPGVRRFEKRVRFSTIPSVKAGWLIKDEGTWLLTDAGRMALEEYPDPLEFMQVAVRHYDEWKSTLSPEVREAQRRPTPPTVDRRPGGPPSFPSELPSFRRRAAEQFQTNPRNLSNLLDMLDVGKIVLPEFQRSFVWQASDIDLLLTSLLQSYPAGTLLLLRVDPSNPLAWRPVEGAEISTDSLVPDYLVLDGQQRLTSLSLALNGRGDHLFFADLVRLARGDVEGGIFPLRRAEARRYGFHRQETLWERSVYPIAAVMGAQENRFWFEDYVEFHVQKGEDRDLMRARRRFLEETYIGALAAYRFPVVELPADTDLEAVCQIFENLNKTGVRLTVFDLLTAKYWPRGLHLREELEAAREEYPLLAKGEFNVEPTFLLQAISLLRSGGCKRGDLLAIEREGFETDWKRVCAGASEALTLLRNECGVLNRQWLPYAALFPALFAVAAQVREMSGPAVATAWEKVKQWFWCSAFGQRYEGPVNTLNATDYRQLREWFDSDEKQPEAVTSFSLDQLELRSVERQRSAVYRAVICLTIVNGARDFHAGQRLTADSLKDSSKRVEDHHIFPSGFLRRQPKRRPPENSVLNKCLIDQRTNRNILDKAPSRYLAEIDQQLGVDAVDSILSSHLIPTSEPGHVRRDDLDSFLAARERLLVGAIAGLTGAAIGSGGPSDAYLDPAKPFMNELALRKVIRNLRGRVFWYEQHMSRKALEILAEEVDRDAVESIQLLSGGANINDQTVRGFGRFVAEMSRSEIEAEWRILSDPDARTLHARVIFDDDETWELPPLNSLLKGTVDSIRRSGIKKKAFLDAWAGPDVKTLTG